ncbi:MAG: DUF4382 domain-containing protein [Bacteroidetes bacterium]|nr:DUF4382 domain-containing protein [Bacteroidota bacterium]
MKLIAINSLRNTLFLLIITILFGACGQKDVNDNQPLGGKAVFQVRMTDYPANYDAVLIDIMEIQVHSNAEGWKSIQTNDGIYDLLELTNGIDTVIAEDELPSGIISQIRFILGDQNSVVVEGDTLSLSIPSGQSSGLKLNLHYELMPGISYAVLIDFDAAASIHQTGNGNYKLKPVLKVIAKGTDGSIRGQLDPQVFAQIYAIDPISLDTSGAFSNDEGKFLISGLQEGLYRVEIWPVDYPMQVLEDVIVINGVISDLGIIVLH